MAAAATRAHAFGPGVSFSYVEQARNILSPPISPPRDLRSLPPHHPRSLRPPPAKSRASPLRSRAGSLRPSPSSSPLSSTSRASSAGTPTVAGATSPRSALISSCKALTPCTHPDLPRTSQVRPAQGGRGGAARAARRPDVGGAPRQGRPRAVHRHDGRAPPRRRQVVKGGPAGSVQRSR